MSEGKLSISRISGLPSSIKEVGTVTCVCMCVQFSILSNIYVIIISVGLCLCLLMWLSVGIYGISSIILCQL